jgi:hypothetical protein
MDQNPMCVDAGVLSTERTESWMNLVPRARVSRTGSGGGGGGGGGGGRPRGGGGGGGGGAGVRGGGGGGGARRSGSVDGWRVRWEGCQAGEDCQAGKAAKCQMRVRPAPASRLTRLTRLPTCFAHVVSRELVRAQEAGSPGEQEGQARRPPGSRKAKGEGRVCRAPASRRPRGPRRPTQW